MKKGAQWELDYYAVRERVGRSIPSPARKPPKKRRCLFCGRPILLMTAPLVLVVVFAVRNQRLRGEAGFGSLQGYTVTLDAVQDGGGILAAILVRPSNQLGRLLLRAPTAEPGAPIEVLLTVRGSSRKPVLLYGQTPGGGVPDTILQARVGSGEEAGGVVLAQVSIGGKTISLTRAAEALKPTDPATGSRSP